ncbi:hypothetical protein DFH11DRAFT_588603 [Phellopilus nigrolimitatus]|nr:hypothetical protein DFH11DRAFT_588603 [Phellopilus nigrolimitatus]
MRPSEHASRSGEGAFERGQLTAPGRAASPSPSLSAGSYYDDDEEAEEESYSRETGQSSHAELTGPTFGGASTSAGAAPPQKPKRTRQLTTPHQSAVLHALLAQSRFPTTAMREEVGRQIGLSARKVQVWFQNQRQKARKGSKDAAAAATPQRIGPPQFGPYTNVPTNLPHAPSFLPSHGFTEELPNTRPRPSRGHAGESSSGVIFPGPAPGPVLPPLMPSGALRRRGSEAGTELHHVAHLPGSLSFGGRPGARLTGPGVPGTSAAIDPYAYRTSPPLPPAAYPRPLSPGLSFNFPPVHTPPLPTIMHREGQARAEAAIYGLHHYEHDLPPHSVRLPPLQLDREPRRSIDMDTGRRLDLPPRSSTPRGVRSHFSRFAAEVSPTSVSPQTIPPPFTLEPSPVWASSSAISSVRPHSSLGVRSGSVSFPAPLAGPSSRVETRRASETGQGSLLEHRTLPIPARMTRFDPVRDPEITAERQFRRLRSRSPDEG